RYHATADIFCAPATGRESFGIVLLEAMAAGLPVVATEIPGYLSVVESGVDSLTVRPKSPLELGVAMTVLARDPELRRRLGTAGGMAVTFGAAGLVGFGGLRWAALVLAFAGTFDILDGALARATNRSYPYGAFLDSTTDRYSEGAVYMGIAAYFLWQKPDFPWSRWAILACVAALAGSFLVSYVRARAQSLGYQCDIGFFAR